MKLIFFNGDIPHVTSNRDKDAFTLYALISYMLVLRRFTLTYPYPDTVLGFIIITNYQKVKKNISRMMRFLSKTSGTRSVPTWK